MQNHLKPRELRWTPELIERYWDWQSQFPENYFTYIFGQEIADLLSVYLTGRDNILDFGCGMGFLLPHLNKYAKSLAGAEVSEQSIISVNAKYRDLPNFAGAALVSELISKGRKFDAVIAVEVIEHLYDAELETMIDQIKKLLAPNGIVIFTTPNEEELALNTIYCPESNVIFHRWQHVRSWSKSSLEAYLKTKGLSVVNTRVVSLRKSPPKTPFGKAKWWIKQALRLIPSTPHLISVTSIPGNTVSS